MWIAQTAVFGDAGNDLSMMSEGDLSSAMANASQDVIEALGFIAPSNNEAGVAQDCCAPCRVSAFCVGLSCRYLNS